MKRSMKALLFDLDDTLYDEATFVVSGFRVVAAYVAERFGLDEEKIFSTMMEILKTEGRCKVFDRMLELHGLYSPQLVAELVNLYRSHLPQISLYPDVQPTFQALRECGVKLGIITDGLHTVQKRKVAALGLQNLVDIIIYTDELGQEYWKPHPAAFQKAIVILDMEPTEILYVGNDPVKDFAGPNLLGMITVHLRRTRLHEKCNCTARVHISTLPQILKIIAGR